MPSYIGQTVVTYRFSWSASFQKKDTSYSDLNRYFNKLKTEINKVNSKIKEIDRNMPINSNSK